MLAGPPGVALSTAAPPDTECPPLLTVLLGRLGTPEGIPVEAVTETVEPPPPLMFTVTVLLTPPHCTVTLPPSLLRVTLALPEPAHPAAAALPPSPVAVQVMPLVSVEPATQVQPLVLVPGVPPVAEVLEVQLEEELLWPPLLVWPPPLD